MDRRFSIITKDLEHCIVCGTTFNIHKHEIFHGTANRKLSIKYGLVIPLCGKHHNLSNEGIHYNHDLELKFKKIAQKRFQEVYPDLNFLNIFGRNYL